MDRVGSCRARAVGIRYAVIGIGGLRSTVADGSAQRALCDPQCDVDHVIVGTTTIGKPRQIAAQHAEIVLRRQRRRYDGGIQPEHFARSDFRR